MHYFHYHLDELYCEEVPVKEIVHHFGTPVYIYSARTIKRHYTVFNSSFEGIPHLICYSVKANSNLGVLALLAKEGAGADVVSKGELIRALKAGIPQQKIVFSGVGKTKEELELGLKTGILMFNVESFEELEILGEIAKTFQIKAPFSVRINPNVDPKTHPYISTGLKKNKFGIPEEEAIEAYLWAKKNPYLLPIGLDSHIGSQITELSPFIGAVRRLKKLWQELTSLGFELQFLDVGGGLGIPYAEEEPPPPKEYAQALVEELKPLALTLILEPGRVIVGNAGILVTRVLYRKRNGEKKFVIVDAGMNDLIRPSLYQAYHRILPVHRKNSEEEIVDVVGPICESGDFFARDRRLPKVERGDLLAIMSAGAYGFVMSSNYNSRPRVPEVLVDGSSFYLVRRREIIEDLLLLENIPEGLL